MPAKNADSHVTVLCERCPIRDYYSLVGLVAQTGIAQQTFEPFKQRTVKLVYKDHPMDQQNVLLISWWSLYAVRITWKVYLWGPVKCDLYKQVVFIYKWSLEQV